MNENFTCVSLAALIKTRKFDWVDPSITSEHFSIPDRLYTNYILFHFGKYTSSKEAVKRMQVAGYEPANFHELLLWEEWNGKDVVVALGFILEVHNSSHTPFLQGDGSKRYLYLDRLDHDWSANCCFLAVLKS